MVRRHAFPGPRRPAGRRGPVAFVNRQPWRARVRRFLRDESGATAIEYGLILILLTLAILGALTTMGQSLSGTFNKVSNKLS